MSASTGLGASEPKTAATRLLDMITGWLDCADRDGDPAIEKVAALCQHAGELAVRCEAHPEIEQEAVTAFLLLEVLPVLRDGEHARLSARMLRYFEEEAI